MAVKFTNKNSAFKGQEYNPSVELFNNSKMKIERILSLLKVKNSQKDVALAAELQSFLFDIKNYEQSSDEMIASLVKQIFGTNDISNKIKNIFRNKEGDHGVIFEQRLVEFLNRLFNDPDNIGGAFSRTGEIHGTAGVKFRSDDVATMAGSSFTRIVSQDVCTEAKNIYNKTVNNTMKKFNKDTNIIEARYLKGVDIKPDMMGNNQNLATIEILRGTKIGKALEILQSRTFSLKNYRKNTVHLGKTGFDRVLTSTLSFINPRVTGQDIVKIYLANQNTKHKDQWEKIENKMRLAYELTGIGQRIISDEDGDITLGDLISVDFLIVNRHNSNKIAVKSTKAILNDWFNDVNSSKVSFRKGETSINIF